MFFPVGAAAESITVFFYFSAKNVGSRVKTQKQAVIVVDFVLQLGIEVVEVKAEVNLAVLGGGSFD